MAQLKSTHIFGNLAVDGNIVASNIIKNNGTNEQLLLAGGGVINKSVFATQADVNAQVATLTSDIGDIQSSYVSGPSSATVNAIALFNAGNGKSIIDSPATIAFDSNKHLQVQINNVNQTQNVSLALTRGAYAGWNFLNKDGNLYVQTDWKNSKQNQYFNVLTLHHSTGNGTLTGTLTAAGFALPAPSSGEDTRADKILLGNGGFTSLSTINTGISNLTAKFDDYALKSDIVNVYKYKGSKNSVTDLPIEGNIAGDVWNITTTDANYAWTGEEWDLLGSIVDLSDYATLENLEDEIDTLSDSIDAIGDSLSRDKVSKAGDYMSNDLVMATGKAFSFGSSKDTKVAQIKYETNAIKFVFT